MFNIKKLLTDVSCNMYTNQNFKEMFVDKTKSGYFCNDTHFWAKILIKTVN